MLVPVKLAESGLACTQYPTRRAYNKNIHCFLEKVARARFDSTMAFLTTPGHPAT